MTRRAGLGSLLAVVVAAAAAVPAGLAKMPGGCPASPVHYEPYPGSDPGLSGIPWVRDENGASGLVGLLWYWPDSWRASVARGRITAGGRVPRGPNTKILWAFLAPSAVDAGGPVVTVFGRRLDAAGRFEAEFSAIGYEGQNGGPSYASIVVVPAGGCWRLTLATGRLRGQVTLLATPRPGR